MEKAPSRLQPRSWINRKVSPLSLIGNAKNLEQSVTRSTTTDTEIISNNKVSGKVKDEKHIIHLSIRPVNSVNDLTSSSRMDSELFSRLRARRVMMEKLEEAAVAVASANHVNQSKPTSPSCRTNQQSMVSQLKRPRPPDKPRPLSVSVGGSSSVTSASGELRHIGIDDGKKDHVTEVKLVLERTTSDLRETRTLLRERNLTVEALSVVLQHVTDKMDQKQRRKSEQTRELLRTARYQIEELCRQRESLKSELVSLSKRYEAELRRQEKLHQTALQTEELRSGFNLEVTRQEVIDKYSQELDQLKVEHEASLSALEEKHVKELETLSNEHQAEKARVQAEANAKINEMTETHRKQFDDVTRRFEQTQQCLSERSAQLRRECEDRRRREKQFEVEHQRIQASAKVNLNSDQTKNGQQQELESLRAVLDMRNYELNQLRTRNHDIEKQLEATRILRDTNEKLQHKVENLEAIINIKADYERDLAEKHRGLLRRFDAESKAMKRLSMDNEQLAWRLSQSALDTSPSASGSSPPTQIGSTPDMFRFMSSMTKLPTSPNTTSSFSNHVPSSPSSNFRRQRPKSMVALSQTADSSDRMRRALPSSPSHVTVKKISSIKQSDV